VLSNTVEDMYLTQTYSNSHFVLNNILSNEDGQFITSENDLLYNTDTATLDSISINQASNILLKKIDINLSDVMLYLTLYEVCFDIGHIYYTYPTYVDLLYGVRSNDYINASSVDNIEHTFVTYPQSYTYYDNINESSMQHYIKEYMAELLCMSKEVH
jgi:hypothetical protein